MMKPNQRWLVESWRGKKMANAIARKIVAGEPAWRIKWPSRAPEFQKLVASMVRELELAELDDALTQPWNTGTPEQ